MDINEIISATIISVIGIIITGIIIPLAKRFAVILDKKAEELKGKLTEDQLMLLKEFISIAVKAAEQIYKTEEFAKKKQSVVDSVTEFINKGNIHIELTTDQLDTIIESIVIEVKKELKLKDLQIETHVAANK